MIWAAAVATGVSLVSNGSSGVKGSNGGIIWWQSGRFPSMSLAGQDAKEIPHG
jgi:hypothetical protein